MSLPPTSPLPPQAPDTAPGWAPPQAPPGQWVWAPAQPGVPGSEGRWVWMAWAAPPPPSARATNQTGRIGLFVAGYFGLGLVYWLYELVLMALGTDETVEEQPGVVVVVSAAFALALLGGAAKARRTAVDPLGVLAAFGSAFYVAMAAGSTAVAFGAEGSGIFWTVVLVSLPYSLAVLLWQPHPILGINVAVATTAFVIGAPLGDGTAIVSGKALLLAIVLAGLGVTVDLRTRSRAGSILHYWAVAVFVFADIALAVQLRDLAAAGIVAMLALAQIFVALMMRRRSWAVSGWVTLVLALVGATGAAPGAALVGSLAGGLVAVPIGFAAFTLQIEGEKARHTVLGALPPKLAASFPR